MEFITSFGGESDSGAKSSGNEGDNDGKKKKVRHIFSDTCVCTLKRSSVWLPTQLLIIGSSRLTVEETTEGL